MVEIERAFQSVLHSNFFVSQILHDLEVCWTIFYAGRGVLRFTSIAVYRLYHNWHYFIGPDNPEVHCKVLFSVYLPWFSSLRRYVAFSDILLYNIIKFMFRFHFCPISCHCTTVYIHVLSTLSLKCNELQF